MWRAYESYRHKFTACLHVLRVHSMFESVCLAWNTRTHSCGVDELICDKQFGAQIQGCSQIENKDRALVVVSRTLAGLQRIEIRF